jgi:AraC-like DNA-binding protein
VVAGRLVVDLDGSAPTEVPAGSIILLPRNARHSLGSAPGLRPAAIDHLIKPSDGVRPAALQVGGDGEETHLICGYLGCDIPDNPLIASLPQLLCLNTRGSAGDAWLSDSFQRAEEEFSGGGVGSSTVLSKLAELLFVEAVRRYMANLPADQSGWLAGLRDSRIGHALALLHSEPARAWSAGMLAKSAGMSRSAFASRFLSLVGLPPMRYLGRWRLQLAAARLRESSCQVSRVAYDVGYESEAAFHRAFKSAFGVTPGEWRAR